MNVSVTLTHRFIVFLLLWGLPHISFGQVNVLEYLSCQKDASLNYNFNSSIYAGAIIDLPNQGTACLSGGATCIQGVIGANTLTYTPTPGFTGLDSMVISLTSGQFTTTHRLLIIQVLPHVVTAVADYAKTTTGTPISINLTQNDLSTGPKYLDAIALANNGSVSIQNDSTVLFTPSSGFTGPAQFRYVVCADATNCANAVVTVQVTPSGNAVERVRVATNRNTSKTLLLDRGNGVGNPSPAPQNGTLINPTLGSWDYRPNNNFTGVDSFTVAWNTNGNPQVTTFVIDVLNTPTLNVFTRDDYEGTAPNTSVVVDVLGNDIGPNLTLTNINVAPQNGTASLVNGKIQYTPNTGFSGLDKLRYRATRGGGSTLTEFAWAYIFVSDFRPAATTFQLSTTEDQPMVVNYKVPITNFDFVLTQEESDQGGTIEYFPGIVNMVLNGQTVNGYNLVVYTPPTGFTGLDQFDLQYVSGNTTRTVKVKMSVQPTPSSGNADCLADCVWSGDANNDGVVNMNDLLTIGYTMGLAGNARNNATTDWYAQGANPWNQVPGLGMDLKFVDTDGNGLITDADTMAVSQHYLKQHQVYSISNPPSSAIPLFFVPRNPNPQPGDHFIVDIILGTNNLPAVNMSGLAFTVNYNANLIVPGSAQLTFTPKNWMAYNSPMLGMVKYPNDGKVDAGYARTVSTSASGFGIIGKFEGIITDDVDGVGSKNGSFPIRFEVDMASAVNGFGQHEKINGTSFDLNIQLGAPSAQNAALDVWPNPSQGNISTYINGSHASIRQVQLIQLDGTVLYDSGRFQGTRRHDFQVEGLPDGLYLVRALTTEGVLSSKVELIQQ